MRLKISLATIFLALSLSSCSSPSSFTPTDADFSERSIGVVELQYGDCVNKYASKVKFEYMADKNEYDELKSPAVIAYLNETETSIGKVFRAVITFDVAWNPETQTYESMPSYDGGPDTERFRQFLNTGCETKDNLDREAGFLPFVGKCDTLASTMAGYLAFINGESEVSTRKKVLELIAETASKLESFLTANDLTTSDKSIIQEILIGLNALKEDSMASGQVSNSWMEVEYRCGF